MNNESFNTLKEKNGANKASTFTRRLNWANLSYPQKFVVIAIIFALPLIAFTPLIIDRFIQVDRYGYKEAQGATYLRQVWQLADELYLFHGAVINYNDGLVSQEKIQQAILRIDSDLITLRSAGKTYNSSLGIDFDFNKLQTEWDDLKNNIQSELVTQEGKISHDSSFDTKLSVMSLQVDQLIKQIGNKSYLILDPDLDTYYMMETIFIKLPENQSLTFELWHNAEELIVNQDLTPSDLFKINALISAIENNLLTIEQNIKTSVENNSGEFMKPIVSAPLNNYIAATRAFTNLIRKNVLETQSIQIDLEAVYTSYSNANDSGNIFYRAASKSLETGLRTRINSLNLRLYASMFLAILSVLIAFVIGINMMFSINRPLLELISATEKFAAGEMSARITNTANADEVGRAALTFNQMAEDMEKSQTTLKAYTNALERRSLELETIAEVAREITIIRDVDTLLNVTVNLISERFKYYHVGIFLIDDNGEYAYLRAANSVTGQQMLDQNYKIKIGQESLVGNVTRTGRAGIAQDVGQNVLHFKNPFLPDTHSEIALPLRSRSVTIGALDIQTDTSSAFEERDINILQLLADQLAAAIENAQLVKRVEKTFSELNTAYRLQTQGVWQSVINKRDHSGYEYNGMQIQSVPQGLPNDLLKQLEAGKAIIVDNESQIAGEYPNKSLLVPITVRNQIIGVIGLEQENPNRAWTGEEIAIAEAAANRAGVTLENARLLDDSQKRAVKERAIFEATTRIGSALNMENILHVTAEEIERILGDAEVILQFNNDNASSTNEK